jgi:hypothetical protein
MKRVIYLVIAAITVIAGCKKNEETATVGIHGFVVTSGVSVNAAAILLTPGGGVKITGSDGRYEFGNLAPGRYEIKVFKENFLSYNQTIDVSDGNNKEVNVTLNKSAGNLSINKSYIDMGFNESNNTAGFNLVNSGNVKLKWAITNAAGWITKIEPVSDTVLANSQTAVVITIDRSKLNANTQENYANLVIHSTTDGSIAELLVTVFGQGNEANSNNNNCVTLLWDGIMVQANDISSGISGAKAINLCINSRVGNYSDWRVPTLGELRTLYSKKTEIGGFSSSTYWSSTDEKYSNCFYCINFYSGIEKSYDYNLGYNSFRVRAVRTLP